MLDNSFKEIKSLISTIERCIEENTFSLLDKDLILEKLRLIYQQVNDEVVINKPITATLEEQEVVSEEQSQEEVKDDKLEDNIPSACDPKEEEAEEEEEENELSNYAHSENYNLNNRDDLSYMYMGGLSSYLSSEDFENICNDLFNGDKTQTDKFLTQLDDYKDFDQAIIFIQETLSNKLNNDKVEMLANAITLKLI